MASTITVRANDIKFLSTGADGGHIYVRGKGEFEDDGVVDVYAHFSSKEMEKEFKQKFKDGTYEFVSTRWDFMKEIGLSLWEVIEWKYLNNSYKDVR